MFKTEKGFTLIELLATIVILGLLALIVTPGVAKVIRNSKINTAKASLEGYVRELENASALYMTDTGSYPTDIDVLELDGKNIDKIENPDVTLNNGEIEEVKAEIDGLYCKYKKGEGTSCSEEPIIEYAGTLVKDFYEKSGRTDRSVISSLTFYSDGRTLEGEVYDVSDAQDGKILMYVNTYSEDTSYYDVTIVGDGVIYLPPDSSYMFSLTRSSGCGPTRIGYSKSISFNDSVDTSKVENMSYMFDSTGSRSEEFTLDLGDKFDTSNVTDMSYMFKETGLLSLVFTLDLGDKFDTSKVTDMSYMFARTGNSSEVFTLDLGDKFDTSNVTNMSYMFQYTGDSNEVFTLDLGNKFDTSNVTDMSYMFQYTGDSSEVFTLDLGDKFDTSNVTDMSYMFNMTGYSSEVFTLDLGDKFDTSNVTNMSDMFREIGYSNPNFTLDLSGFNTSNVTNMSDMFWETGYSNPNFTLDLSGFDTSKVTSMHGMFRGLSNLKTIYVSEKWTTNTVTSSYDMFTGCTSLPNFNSSVVDKTNAHYNTGGYLTLKTD